MSINRASQKPPWEKRKHGGEHPGVAKEHPDQGQAIVSEFLFLTGKRVLGVMTYNMPASASNLQNWNIMQGFTHEENSYHGTVKP